MHFGNTDGDKHSSLLLMSGASYAIIWMALITRLREKEKVSKL